MSVYIYTYFATALHASALARHPKDQTVDGVLFLTDATPQVEHLLTENERITAKEGGQGGLTEGQQAQLARNDKAISAVRLQARYPSSFLQ